ncbi:MAG: pilus assembly protein PilP [Bdellovibrio sp.]|nr:pilus assembly protein PilP [Bdellovibrio sp.]
MRKPSHHRPSRAGAFALLFLISFPTLAQADTSDPTSASNPSTSSSAPATGVSAAPVPSSGSSANSTSNGGVPGTAAGQEVVVKEAFLEVRDPFKKPELLQEKVVKKTPLEKFPADGYIYRGLLTGPVKLRALIVDPEGNTFFVSEKMHLGSKGGVIVSITPEKIKVREKALNLLGQEESVYVELTMPGSKGTAKEGTVGGTSSGSSGGSMPNGVSAPGAAGGMKDPNLPNPAANMSGTGQPPQPPVASQNVGVQGMVSPGGAPPQSMPSLSLPPQAAQQLSGGQMDAQSAQKILDSYTGSVPK